MSATHPTVLAVDDEPFNLSLMDELLNRDYIVQKAGNGPDAIKLAFTTPPDLALIDIMMPDMDGFEVCRFLKNNPATRHVPVIFITAKDDIRDEERGFAMGASDFIHKPISAPIVLARVRAHIKIKFMQDYLRRKNSLLIKSADEKSAELQQLRDFMWGSDMLARR
ncbi:MAG: response regulator [Gammaproteobacteria bacterium]|nr:response regulator [Gammaproteobacteria bacterium]MBU1777738.1 response regulator [Gammaproteobacteria bacterium]MBU1967752.1 response regulator [Gammaproteobacteria bacterium]